MEQNIAGKTFTYIPNPLRDDERRAGYFALAKQVFGLDFGPWYGSGFCGDGFRPYTLYDGGIAVASVGVVASRFKSGAGVENYVQISTVMTAPDYRGMGLSGWLMERVLAEWRGKRDLVYLYANDSVVGFYPRYSFVETTEYAYSVTVPKREGTFRRLDLSAPGDLELLTARYRDCNNPFSAITMEDNLSQLMFHCITFLRDCLYYVEEYDAVVVAKREDSIVCYDIYTGADCAMNDILGVLVQDEGVTVNLGFTPVDAAGCACEKSREPDTTVFVLGSGDTIFSRGKIMLPLLSRA